MTLDGNGVALIIGAVAAGIVTVGGFTMQVITFLDTRRVKRDTGNLTKMSAARDVKIQEVKDLVNGKSDQLNAVIAKDAFEAGRMHERVMPGQPSPAAVSVVLTPPPAPTIVSEGGKPVEPKSGG
jgi:hypothetical protein